jgi:hypothetical protein
MQLIMATTQQSLTLTQWHFTQLTVEINHSGVDFDILSYWKKTDASGEVQFLIDELENFDPNQPIYIHDDETDTYHEIRYSL